MEILKGPILKDVIYHNEAYSRSNSSIESSPVSSKHSLKECTPSPKSGSFVSAVIGAIRNAATHPFVTKTVDKKSSLESAKQMYKDISMDSSSDLLDFETEPCLMMESVLEDVTLPDTYSHNMISSSDSLRRALSFPETVDENNIKKTKTLDECTSLTNLTQAILHRRKVQDEEEDECESISESVEPRLVSCAFSSSSVFGENHEEIIQELEFIMPGRPLWQVAGKREASQEAEAQQWIETIVGERFPSGVNYEDALRDGVLLCKLMNKLQPGIITKINTSGGDYKMMDNLNQFQKACTKYGVPDVDLFQAVDLMERKNIAQVTNTIFAIGRTTYKHPEWRGPWLGPKPAEENKRSFTEEQLRAGETLIGLQAGTNKGATQAGQNFGATRKILLGK